MNRYASRGVSSSKEEVHAVVDKLDRGLYPGAFCKITADFLTGNPAKANLIHSDGSGTKSIIAYLHYKETGDASVFRGIAQDSVVMNIDDLLCAGIVSHIVISSTINRNAKNCPGEVLGELIGGTEEFLQVLRDHGIDVQSGGGETADVGDLTGTIVVDTTAVAIVDRDQIIDNDNIRDTDVIIGLASFGKSKYEKSENSGIGSNGLTSGRHDLLSNYYSEKYPETFDPELSADLCYCGPYRLEDKLPASALTVGQGLLSPTRTYAPVIFHLLKEYRKAVHGLVHCSGGGQTKCIRFGHSLHYVKDDLFDIPPIFKAIKDASETEWNEMFKVYNMGHRMEIYADKSAADDIVKLSKSFGIEARIIGHVEAGSKPHNMITIKHKNGTSVYGE